jgi:hypothetical protein
MMFLRDLLSKLFSSPYTPVVSILLYLIHIQIIICMQMILNFSYHCLLLTFNTIALILNLLYLMSTRRCHLTFFLSIPPRPSFFLLVFLNNSQNSVNPTLHQSNNVTPSLVHPDPILEVIFNANFSKISAVSKSCFYHIRDLRRIQNTIDHTTECTIATSLIHF